MATRSSLTGALLIAALIASAASVATAQTAAPAATVSPNEYRLGSGDVVRITVFQNPDLTLETRVTEAGIVSYPPARQCALGWLVGDSG